MPALCAALLAQLAAPPAAGEAGGPQPTLRDLHTRLTAFVEARRSWLTRPPLASEAALQERASALRGALQAAGAPCAVDADAAAPRLVAAWDAVGTAHCVEAVAPCHLAEHKTGCPFRPVRCPHEGCLAHAAASALARHDAACGFKPVPCAQGCGAMVPRNQSAQTEVCVGVVARAAPAAPPSYPPLPVLISFIPPTHAAQWPRTAAAGATPSPAPALLRTWAAWLH